MDPDELQVVGYVDDDGEVIFDLAQPTWRAPRLVLLGYPTRKGYRMGSPVRAFSTHSGEVEVTMSDDHYHKLSARHYNDRVAILKVIL